MHVNIGHALTVRVKLGRVPDQEETVFGFDVKEFGGHSRCAECYHYKGA